MYVPWIFPSINYCKHTMNFTSSLRSFDLFHTIFVLFMNLAYDRCNPTKLDSRGTPCGILTTVMITITSMNLSKFSLCLSP